MKSIFRPSRNPLSTAACLAILTLLLRLPFRSRALFNIDSVNYALGVLDFDVIQHRPHPPGYILYIALARVLNTWLDDPNAALVWISIVSGVLAVIFVYAFARRRFGETDALIAALLTMTNPLIWFYDELALNYSVEAFLSISIAYACYRTIERSTGWAYAGAVMLGLGGGIRQTSLILFLPLMVYAAFHLPWKHRLSLAAIFGGICLAWAIPLIHSAGGLPEYLTASRQLSSIIEAGSFTTILQAIFYGGHIPLLFALTVLVGLVHLSPDCMKPWERMFLALWLLPGLIVILFFHMGQSGYILFALPPLFIYTPGFMRAAYQNLDEKIISGKQKKRLSVKARVNSLVGAILLVNILAFFLGGSYLIKLQNDRWGIAQDLEKSYSPSETIVISGLDQISGFRHASYYLNEYHVYGYVDLGLKGPFYFEENKTTVPGWLFQSYRFTDDYDLNPTHPLKTVLDFPDGKTGMIVTNQDIWEKMVYLDDERTLTPEMTPLGNWFMYVHLPDGATQLVTCQDRLEIR